MRTVLILLLLVALLAGLIVVNRAAADWHYITAGAPGELLYAAAFDGFPDEWEQYNERRIAEIAGGVLRLTNHDPNNGSYSASRGRYADFDLTVDARAVGGPLDNAFGLVFRLQDRENYYTFMVSSDGYYQVGRVVDGSVTELSTFIDSAFVNQGLGAVNRLRVVARGDQFAFYINGEPVQVCVPNNPDAQSTYFMDACIDGQMLDTLTDASIGSGRVGVVVQTFSEPGVSVEFDNMVIVGA